ncbi:MAG: GtrA protein [Patescibacteria group bacterium]|nr:GtrA protein [Patescibacteria group bacterium]
MIIALLRSAQVQKVLRFLIAGTSAAGVNILILFLLVQYGEVHYLLASILSYIGSIAAGFSFQKFWAFQNREPNQMGIQLGGYILVTFGNLCINTALMYVLVSTFGVWYIAAQIICGGVIAITAYVAYQTFVFKKT